MQEQWHTGWDPYEELMMHRSNIEQCAMAINTGSELMKQLSHKYQHQQEVIEQLMFQNRKLQDMLGILKNQISQQAQDIAELRLQK